MRRIALAMISIAAFSGHVLAQVPTPEVAPGAKPNANPCSDEVSAALQKLRKSSWFRMDTHMITENGPTSMQIDYVLPDRMHQTVTVQTTNKTTEVILVGNQAWVKQGDAGWKLLPQQVADQLKNQMRSPSSPSRRISAVMPARGARSSKAATFSHTSLIASRRRARPRP